MKTTMRIEGGAELAAALNKLPTRVSKRVMRDTLETAGEPVRRTMAQLAPREPGAPDLADNIVMSPTKAEGLIDDDETAAIAIGPSRPFFYGLFQETGTAFHGAQPFARPAFDTGVDQALASIVRSTWTALAAVGVSQSVTRDTPVQSDGPLT